MSNEKSKLIIGISSRALFNLDESHEIYEKQENLTKNLTKCFRAATEKYRDHT